MSTKIFLNLHSLLIASVPSASAKASIYLGASAKVKYYLTFRSMSCQTSTLAFLQIPVCDTVTGNGLPMRA